MLHKKFNENLSTCVLFTLKKLIHVKYKKKCLRYNIISKLITAGRFLNNTCKKDLKQRKRTSPSNFTYSN